jgi:CO/xanthine dehydrogenase FAD-binding subunit
MKPAPFRYEAAATVDAALELLALQDARPLAGGQSLVPMLNFRLARPELLVDLNPVDELAGLEAAGSVLRIGAMTRQAALLRSAPVADRWPLLTEAVACVGHTATRSRGTVGGSVAHADPKAELPVALAALDARFHLRSPGGAARRVGVAELFAGPFMTVLEPGELLVEIEVPAPPAGARMAFVEHARTHGDFAVAGVAVMVAPAATAATAATAAIALLGADAIPVRADTAEQALGAGAAAAEVARLAAEGVADDYRRALLAALTERALARVMA